MRRANARVYDELSYAERTRDQLRLTGGDPWTAPAGYGGHLLATWNAFALHTLGQRLLDGDGGPDAGPAGYLPQVTFAQAWR